MYTTRLAFAAAAIISTSLAQTPQGFTPAATQQLGVTFNQNDVVDPAGKAFLTDTTQQQPVLTAPAGLSSTSSYMVVMIDIDVNANGTGTTVLHWLQPDMQLNAQTQTLSVGASNSTTPQIAAQYLPPGPPPGPGHRYVQVLFEQPPNFSVPACFQQATQQNGRLGFDINQLVSTAGLQAPVAGNFVTVSNTQPGPASTPLPTATSLKAAAGCQASASSQKMVRGLEEVLWSA